MFFAFALPIVEIPLFIFSKVVKNDSHPVNPANTYIYSDDAERPNADIKAKITNTATDIIETTLLCDTVSLSPFANIFFIKPFIICTFFDKYKTKRNFNKMSNILVIPDVHGRTFWKEAIKCKDEYSKIIFLGDYVDPYKKEGISDDDALDNFKEIVSFFKENKDKCVMLIGNHDCAYIYDELRDTCRHDYKNENEIKSLFKEIIDDMKLIHKEDVDGTTFIFSHSGVLDGWVSKIDSTIEEIDDDINSMIKTDEEELVKLLCHMSYYRGGYSHGDSSCVWGDVREYDSTINFEELSSKNIFQVFGHTQLYKELINVDKRYACIDTHNAYVIDEEGTIKKIQ